MADANELTALIRRLRDKKLREELSRRPISELSDDELAMLIGDAGTRAADLSDEQLITIAAGRLH